MLDINNDTQRWPVSYVDGEVTPDISGGRGNGSDLLLVVPPEGPNQKAEITRLFEKLHDGMYMRWAGSREGEALNPMSNYDIYYDKLKEKDHLDSIAPYGDVGVSKLVGYSFFSANVGVLRGMLGRQPLIWSIDCVSPEVAIQKIKKVARLGAEGFMREGAKRLAEKGMNLDSTMIDPSLPVPADINALQSLLSEKEEIELVLFDLLRASLLHDKTKKKLDDAFEDRCIINGEIGEVYADSGWPRFKVWKRNQVAWWGKPDIKNADEADAWSLHQLIPLSQAVMQYGSQLEESDNYSHFLKLMRTVSRRQPLWTTYRDGTLRESLTGYEQQEVTGGPVGYGQFYASGAQSQVLEQKLYAKLMRYQPVKLTLNGRELSLDQRKDYDAGILAEAPMVLIESVDQAEYNEMKNKASYKQIGRVEQWESVRLGDRFITYHRPTTIQFRRRHDPVNVSSPIVAHFGSDTSLVTKGLPLHELYTNVMIELRKLVALSGMRALTYDMSELPDGWDLQRVMFEAKESGIIVFNGKRVGGAPTKESYRHLQQVDLSLVNDALAMINLSASLRSMYDELCGVTAGLKGQFQSREALGQTQLSMTQGSLITQKLFAEHEEYSEQVLDKMLRLGQRLWSRNEKRTVILGENMVKTLQLTEEIGLYDFGMFVTSGSKNQEDRNMILQRADQALASGAISFKDLLKLIGAENPFKMLAMIEDGLDAFEKQRSQSMQAQAQAAQVTAQAAQAKAESPVQVAEVTGKWRMQIEQARQAFEAEQNDRDIQFREEKSDLDAQNQLQNQQVQQTGQQQLVAMQNPQQEAMPV